MSSHAIRVAVALGSNVGDRAAHLDFAAAGLSQFVTSLKVSTWHETEPTGTAKAVPYTSTDAVPDISTDAVPDISTNAVPDNSTDVGHRFSGANLFLNGAAVGDTLLSARALLDALLALEHARGRERPFAGAPRTLDLDLVLFGDAVMDEPGLIVPHPRFRERRFVLEPLAEIAPEMIDPVTALSVRQLLSALPRM